MPSLDRASRRQASRTSLVPQVESLESRFVPYAASGNAWPHPELVTLSFNPDGTNLGGTSSNLFATFNARFGSTAAWQNALLKAAQTWAQQANLNFTVVGDNGSASGSGAYQQGDDNFGDIRIGGFNFGGGSLLALAYMPPDVNNYSVAGDLAFNTAQTFNINGMDYDLYSVALHEFGHTLGLNHSGSGAAIMYSSYAGIETVLSPDDINGIRAIYGARQADAFDDASSNGSFASASNIDSLMTSSVTQVPQLDITSTSDVDFYKFVADSTGTIRVTVQSSGLSLLAPSLKAYNASQTQIAGATGSGYLGSTLTVNLNVAAGQTYYIRVAGANTTAFGTGAYGLTINTGSSSAPAIPPPDTQTANGNPLNGGGGVANRVDSHGIPITSLLLRVDRFVNTLSSFGPLGRFLAQTIDYVISNLVELPFASLETVPVGAPLPGNGIDFVNVRAPQSAFTAIPVGRDVGSDSAAGLQATPASASPSRTSFGATFRISAGVSPFTFDTAVSHESGRAAPTSQHDNAMAAIDRSSFTTAGSLDARKRSDDSIPEAMLEPTNGVDRSPAALAALVMALGYLGESRTTARGEKRPLAL